MIILTINAGSSSIKYKVFHCTEEMPHPLHGGLIEGIGEQRANGFATHLEAYAHLKNILSDLTFDAVTHRVVHGADTYYQPTMINQKVRDDIASLSVLAPIHNPLNLQGIDFAREHYHHAKQVAIFDTGFHHTLPSRAKLYPISQETAQKYKLYRYGFHGINHEYVAREAANYLKIPFNEVNLMTLHLGNGASACLIEKGQSIDTSMGLTPLAGLMMGTRCGDIDPAIPMYLNRCGLSINEIDTLLNKKSGLLGIGQDNDMRHLLKRAEEGCKDAALAIEMYVYRIQSFIGSYYAHSPHLNAIVFTGGVGENAAIIRQKIISPLKHLGLGINQALNLASNKEGCRAIHDSVLPILVIKGDEEMFMAKQAFKLIHEHA